MPGEFYQVDYDRNAKDAKQWERVNYALRRIYALLDNSASGSATPSSGGTSDHSQLTNLSYASAGHTGFAPTSHLHPDLTPQTRNINTTAPLQGGGNLSTDRTLSILQGPGSSLDADTVDAHHAYELAPYWGFPNKTDSVMSFSYPTFTIAPAVTSFVFYRNGVKYTKTTPQTVDITDTEGIWFIYFNSSGVLTASQIPWDILDVVSAAYIYWDATNNAVLSFADERHGPVMDQVTHGYLHDTMGTRYETGLLVSGDITGDGDEDVHAELGVTSGRVHDEDIEVAIVDDPTPTPPYQQILAIPAQIPVFYRDGASAWRRKTPNNFPVLEGTYFAPVRDRCSYNQFTGGAWTQTEVVNLDFFAVWIFATNDINYPIMAVLGQRTDTNFSNAQNNNSYNAMSWGTMPFQEFKVIARVIYQTSNGYSNGANARLREIIDYRNFGTVTTAGFPASTQHSSLTGLGSDDHLQYQLRSERAIATGYAGLDSTTLAAGIIPKFSSTGILGDSIITEVSGNIVIGAQPPTTSATVTINSQGGGSGALIVNSNTAAPPPVPHSGCIHIVGKDNDFAALYIDSIGSFGASGGQSYRSIINLRSARGTLAAPEANIAGDLLARVSGRSYGAAWTGTLSSIDFYAAETISATNQGTYATITTTAIGDTGGGSVSDPPERVRFQPSGGVSIGDVTWDATDPGNGILSVKNKIGIATAAPLSNLGVLGNASIGATYGAIAAPTSGLIVEGFVGIGSNAPTSTLQITGGTLPGDSATNNFLNITGTCHATPSATQNGVNIVITTAGSANFLNNALTCQLAAGYTGSRRTTAGVFFNSSAATGANAWVTNGVTSANYGNNCTSSGTTVGHNAALGCRAVGSSTMNIGIVANAILGTNSPALNVGIGSIALNATVNVAGFFGLMATGPTLTTSAALIADNGASGSDIFQARVNGTPTTVINATGNIGIGTITGLAKLSINGGVHVGGDSDPGDNNLLVDGTIAGSNLSGTNTGDDAVNSTSEQIANKGAASGYAPLDASQKVPVVNLGGAGADSTKFLRGDQSWANPDMNTTSGPAQAPSYSGCSLYWSFDEAAPPYPNLGSAGALPLSLYSTAVVAARGGMYQSGAGLATVSPDNKGYIKTTNTSLGESSSISVFTWVKVRSRSDYALIIGKNYNLNDTNAAPYYAWSIRYNNSSNQWFADVCTAGALNTVVITSVLDQIELDQWTLVGFTYDATTGVLNVYKNGELVGTTTVAAAAIDYGTHGSYGVGADFQFTTRTIVGVIDDARVYSTVLTAQEIRNLFRSSYKILQDDQRPYSLVFNATTDWGAASGGYYTQTINHYLGSNDISVEIWDSTTGLQQVLVDQVNQVSVNQLTFRVPETPDGRFAGRIVIFNRSADTEDFDGWQEALIYRTATAIAAQGTTFAAVTTGTAATGVSSIFDDGLPKLYANTGTTINSKGVVTENTEIHKYNPRSRFLCTLFWLSSYGNGRLWYGVGSAGAGSIGDIPDSDTPAKNMLAFRLSLGTDTTWKAVSGNGVSNTVVDTGIPIQVQDVEAEIRWNLGCTVAEFLINGVIVATITTNLPSPSAAMVMFMGIKNLAASNLALRTGHLKLLQTMKP